MSTLKLSVVAPVFNEEEVIGEFHRRLSEVLIGLNDTEARIVYVVDRCTDNTLDVLRNIARADPKTRVIALSARFGHQQSLVAGIEKSLDADVVIMMDSDLQHPPELIPELLERFRDGYEVVYTVRRDTHKIGWFRRWVGNRFYSILGKLAMIPITANAADFRLISGRVARVIIGEFRERNMFLRGLFTWVGFRQIDVKYFAANRAGGHSKYSLTKMVTLATTGIVSFSSKPLQIGIFVGVGFSLLAFILILWAVARYFIDRTTPAGWPTLVVLLLLFSGIQLIVLGIIGVYIGALYEEVKGRPRYLVEEEISGDGKT